MLLLALSLASATPAAGYYRQPALHGETLVFVAEGDLWRVGRSGGVATRLTTHPGQELFPAISPDGKTVAFVANYEGVPAVYTMPLGGGAPTRGTWDGNKLSVAGWTAEGKVIYASDGKSTLPAQQLFLLDPARGTSEAVPLWQASDGAWSGTSLFFTRLPFQGSYTKKYQGGTAQQLWRYDAGAAEAVPLTGDFAGTSKRAMPWKDRVYFVSDRDGTMNLWSMTADGKDLKELTHASGWDVGHASLSEGRIAYQLGADLHVVEVASGADTLVPITLDSDFDQTRQRWIDKPMDWLTRWDPAPDGERVALVARGQVFVAPRKSGRLVQVTHDDGVRWRDARFSADGKSLYALGDGSGEVEVWQLAADGLAAPKRLSTDGHVLRWESVPSPDGKWIASSDKNQDLWLVDAKTGASTKIDHSPIDRITDPRWSPDGRWLTYTKPADNFIFQVWLYDTVSKKTQAITTSQYDSSSAEFSPDGEWLWFLSDRHLETVVTSPWGPLAPEPFWNARTEVYGLALHADGRSPFAPADELHLPKKDDAEADKEKDKPKGKAKQEEPALPPVTIDLDGLSDRLWKVPVAPGNYTSLQANDKGLFFLEWTAEREPKASLVAVEITNDAPELVTVLDSVKAYALSGDGSRMVIQQDDGFVDVEAAPEEADVEKAAIDLSGWSMSVQPLAEWRQMFREAWRLERDYYWDKNLRGIDWKANLAKYEPLVDRVRSREELGDLLGQMVGELQTLHTFVRQSDIRKPPITIGRASLGAQLTRDDASGGWKVARIFRSDPDEVDRRSPLQAPGVHVGEGDVITRINGVSTLTVPDVGVLLRDLAGQQVLLHVRTPGKDKEDRAEIVVPADGGKDNDLRYLDWETTRADVVSAKSGGRFGYIHLRAMGEDDMDTFARTYYPQFNKDGLVIDVRHNRGGNIDSWVLERLMRKVWFYWNQREGRSPNWNMQYGFRGKVVVLCDGDTSSDGEAFSEGIKRLGIGRVIGTRTWGGEVWLSSENTLVDNGIATAAEYGVYGPEGAWLIEGHGVEPDEVVDNLPHASYLGQDAQLDAGLAWLEAELKAHPVPLPPVPAMPPLK